MKLLVVTSAFQAGAIIDDETGKVVDSDHWLGHLRGMTEQEFREYCQKHKWAVQVAR